MVVLAISSCSSMPAKDADPCTTLHERLLRQISYTESVDALVSADTSVENIALLAEAATEAAATAGEMTEMGCPCKPAESCFDLLDSRGGEP